MENISFKDCLTTEINEFLFEFDHRRGFDIIIKFVLHYFIIIIKYGSLRTKTVRYFLNISSRFRQLSILIALNEHEIHPCFLKKRLGNTT